MEQKKPISHIVAGLIIGLILIIYSCALYFSDTQQTGIYGWLPIIFIVVGLVVFVNLYGKALSNQVTFGNLFAYGFKTTAFLTLVVITFTVVFFLIFPEIKEKMFEMTRQKMEEKGNLTEDEIDKGIAAFKKMFWVYSIGGILLIYAIIGAIGSLIGAAITPKKPINPADQLDMR
jgi:hypothetical protein